MNLTEFNAAVDTINNFIPQLHRSPQMMNRVPDKLSTFPQMWRSWIAYGRKGLQYLQKNPADAVAAKTTAKTARGRQTRAKSRGKALHAGQAVPA